MAPKSPATRRRSTSPAKSPAKGRKLDDTLEGLTTEVQFLEALPPLVAQHGRAPVLEALGKLFSSGQVKECMKRLEGRTKLLVWVSCVGADVAMIVTDHGLNEVGRGTWALHAKSSDDVLEFLATYCAQGTCRYAGISMKPQLQKLAKAVPAAYPFINTSDPLDLGSAGVKLFAKLLDLPMLPGGDVRDFETKLKSGQSPALNTPLTKDTPAADRAEFAIISLGWARQHLIVPPKAAKYVTMGIAALFVMLAVSMANLLLSVVWFGVPYSS